MKRIFLSVVMLFVLASALQAAPGRKYLTLGRNPMVPGGISEQRLKPGQQIVSLPYDVYVKDMRGASGERVSGWLPAGTQVVARKVKTTDKYGNEIWAWKVEAAQQCGNTHPAYYAPAPAPPQKPEVRVEYRDRVKTVEKIVREPYSVDRIVEKKVPVYYEVTRTFYTPHPAEEVEVPSPRRIIYYKEGIMDGLLRIGAAYVGRTRVSITQNAPVNTSSAAAAASSSTSSNTNINKNTNENKNNNNLQQQEEVVVN